MEEPTLVAGTDIVLLDQPIISVRIINITSSHNLTKIY